MIVPQASNSHNKLINVRDTAVVVTFPFSLAKHKKGNPSAPPHNNADDASIDLMANSLRKHLRLLLLEKNIRAHGAGAVGDSSSSKNNAAEI